MRANHAITHPFSKHIHNDCFLFVCGVRVLIFHVVIESNCRRPIFWVHRDAHKSLFLFCSVVFSDVACMCDHLKFYLKGQKHLSSVCSLINGLKLIVPSVLLSFSFCAIFSLLVLSPTLISVCVLLQFLVDQIYLFIFVPTHENWPYQNRKSPLTHKRIANFISSIDVSTVVHNDAHQ